MTPAAQDSILREYEFESVRVMRVQAVMSTMPLLRLAGIAMPLIPEFYPVCVRRDSFGRLVVDDVSEQDNEFSPGSPGSEQCSTLGRGHGAGSDPGSISRRSSPAFAVNDPKSLADESTRVESGASSVFEVKVSDRLSVRLEVTTVEDACLDSPLELPNLKSRRPSTVEIAAAAAVLHCARDVRQFLAEGSQLA